MFKFGILLVASYVSCAAALPPCVCARNYQPVCGSDGHTYPNNCMLDCSAQTNPDLRFSHIGACDQPDQSINSCVCTLEYRPVCGIDDKTYPNQCALGCEKARNPVLEKKHDGPCKTAAFREQVKVADLPNLPPCTCTRDMHPVCGTDGVTYNNPCLLECAAQNKPLAKKNDGPCDSLTVKVVEQPLQSCVCTRNYKPVCGSDGTTYANPCVLGCRSNNEPGLTMTHDGPCQKVD